MRLPPHLLDPAHSYWKGYTLALRHCTRLLYALGHRIAASKLECLNSEYARQAAINKSPEARRAQFYIVSDMKEDKNGADLPAAES